LKKPCGCTTLGENEIQITLAVGEVLIWIKILTKLKHRGDL